MCMYIIHIVIYVIKKKKMLIYIYIFNITYRTSEGVWVRDHFSRSPPMSVNSLAMFQSDFKHPPMGGKLYYKNSKIIEI